jgi:hypothetical protein
MKPLMALRLACMLSAAGVIAASLPGCASKGGMDSTASTSTTANAPVRQAAATSASPTGVSPQVSGTGTGGTLATRDWAQVDTNRDGSISPEEMAAYLQANPGPLKGR